MQDLKVTIVQTSLYWENIDKNLDHFTALFENEKPETDLIILPEMFNTGFSMNVELLAEEMNGKTIRWMREFAKDRKCTVIGSLIIKEGNSYYNRLIWMHEDGNCQSYDKRHLFSLAREDEKFTGGSSKLLIELNEWKICPMVCYDLRFPVWTRNTMDINNRPDYDCLIFIANWPEKRSYAWKSLLIARAIENQAYVIGVNRIGNDGNNIPYFGDSSIIDYTGRVLFSDSNEEFMKHFTLKKEELIKYRRAYQFLADADEFEIQ